MKRVIELDFFRGVALLIIFWDHLHWFVRMGAPLKYGFSDAATVFIFLSGYVSGLVYGKVYNLHGFRRVFVKAVRRAFQIYSAHIIALSVLIFIAAITPENYHSDPLHKFYNKFSDNTFSVIFKSLTLQSFPRLFDILPLYIVLIIFVPFVLVLLKKNWWVVPLFSFLLYTATQFIPLLNIKTYFASWSLNPFSWLFLFATAITLAVKKREGIIQIPVRRLFVIVSFGFLIYAFSDLTLVNNVLQMTGLVTAKTLFLFPSPFPLTSKILLQPVSLIHFFCLAYFVSCFTPKFRNLFNSWIAKPFVICGQHSLALFSAGIVLTYLFSYLIIFYQLKSLYFFLFALLGWTLTILLAISLSNRKKLNKIKIENSKLLSMRVAETIEPKTKQSLGGRRIEEAAEEKLSKIGSFK